MTTLAAGYQIIEHLTPDTLVPVPVQSIAFWTIEPDHDVDNPLTESDYYGEILGLNRRLTNYDRDRVGEALGLEDPDTRDPLAVQLSYYEHGQSRWFVTESIDPGRFQHFEWDGTTLAGCWLPGAELRTELAGLPLEDQIAKCRERAVLACSVYTDWANGNVTGYTVNVYPLACDEDNEPITDPDLYEDDEPTHADSCWGYVGDYDTQSIPEKDRVLAWIREHQLQGATVVAEESDD